MDLSLIDTETLYRELCSRNDAVVLILHRVRSNNDDETEYYWSGGKATAVGLLEFAKLEITAPCGECDD